jgi:hypothetical protein
MPSLRPASCGLVTRALAKDPAHRHRSWEQFLAAARGALAICERVTTAVHRRPAGLPPAARAPTPRPEAATPAHGSASSDSARRAVADALKGLPPPPRVALPPVPPPSAPPPSEALPGQVEADRSAAERVADWISSRFQRRKRP